MRHSPLPWLPLVTLLGAGCSLSPMLPHDPGLPAQVLSLPQAPPLHDGRTRFREIFCTLLASQDPGQGANCADLLLRFQDESAAAAIADPLPRPSNSLRVFLVPGLYNDCVSHWVNLYGETLEPLGQLGYRVEMLPVDSRSGAQHNARQIAAYLSALPLDADQRLVLMGHSKGAVDILHFLLEHPDVARRTAAVVSLAGAVNGSPLADFATADSQDWNRLIPEPPCPAGDNQALHSLRRDTRLTWLSRHPLPQSVRYFSIVSVSDPDTVIWPLRYTYSRLAEIDPRNDGLLLSSDQVIPGCDLLGYVAADHWRIAYPVEAVVPFVRNDVADPAFPRSVLLQAIILYVQEAIAHAPAP